MLESGLEVRFVSRLQCFNCKLLILNKLLVLPCQSSSTITGHNNWCIDCSLEASDENYLEAWKMLKERYDDDSLIIQKHIRALFELPVLSKENHTALRRMLDTVLKHIRALKALKRPTEQWDDIMIFLVTSRLDQTTSKEWETSIKKGEIPNFTQLTDFLAQRCRALEASARTHKVESNVSNKGKSSKCSKFAQLTVDQRIQEARTRKLCLNCLKAASHQAKQCGSGTCRKCGKRHNTLLHLEQTQKSQSEPTSSSTASSSGEKVTTSSVTLAAVRQERKVLLATAIVNVIDFKGERKPCRALLDCGSQSCFATANCVQRLGLKHIATDIPISGLGELSTQTRRLTKMTIQSRINGYQAKLDCLIIEKITQSLPANQLDIDELKIPDGITLADPDFDKPATVDLLIGAEIFFELLCIGKIKLAEDQPTWQKTVLGWIVSGKFMMRDREKKSTFCHLAVNDELNAGLSRFWQIEHHERQNTRTPEERFCEAQFSQTYKRNAEGRFIVTLPTRDEQLQKLGDSRETALQRFKMLERKFERKPQLKAEYSAFIHEYSTLQHMRELSEDSVTCDIRPHFYLPHHCVIKETSTTTRLRVVFDASSKTTSGISLNDALMVGPVIQQDLFSTLLRFRSFEYSLTADIAKMYRQVLVDETQVPLQRIVWRDRTNDNIKTYELLTLTYGTAPASFLATKVIHELADIEENKFPIGALVARRDFYVDDLITGAHSEKDALTIREETTALLQRGGLVLRQWASNSKKLLKDISGSSTTSALLESGSKDQYVVLSSESRCGPDETHHYRVLANRAPTSNSHHDACQPSSDVNRHVYPVVSQFSFQLQQHLDRLEQLSDSEIGPTTRHEAQKSALRANYRFWNLTYTIHQSMKISR
ncbi:uncharacterized protein LOC124409453 [Diprion similis]|uniref:uncharacterized protein LOC124409453 n=1 Tax=Diprion similis TaxID=362088 RepID=UPI001EF993EA|nr:uncharacterized protein LOC124409453 [Diprion similis]